MIGQMKGPRPTLFRVALVLVAALGPAIGMAQAAATIDAIAPDSLTIAAGDSGSAQVTVSSAAGSCLTATANAGGIDVGSEPIASCPGGCRALRDQGPASADP